MTSKLLNAEDARIFRLTHVANLPWICRNGLHCRSSECFDPDFVNIGNPELIGKRAERVVPCGPGGVLADYIPFYFTPYSPMRYHIHEGLQGIQKRSNRELLFLVASLRDFSGPDAPAFVFTDQHAYCKTARFFTDPIDLARIDWALLQSRDFRRDPEDPERFERYQAEALIFRHLPLQRVRALVCVDEESRGEIESVLAKEGVKMTVSTQPDWFLSP